MLSQREMQLLMLLLQNEDYIPLEKIYTEFHISNRTLLRELSSIKSEILKYSLEVEKKSKYGIKILGKNEIKKELLKKLEKKDFLDYKNKDERKFSLIIEILKNDQLLKLIYFANKLQVSESTISQDLEKAEEWFLNFNIKIERIKGNGIVLKYDELNFRKAILSCIEEKGRLVYIDEQEKLEMQKLVLEAYPKITEELTIESFDMFIEYLTLVLKRVKFGKTLDKNLLKVSFEENEKSSIENIYEKIEKQYQIKLNQNERIMTNLIFKSRKNRKIISFDEEEIKKSELLNLSYRMIDIFDKKMAFELKEDKEFIEGLITHLKPALLRIKYNIPIKNQLKSEIIELYPEIFSKTKKAITVLEEVINKKIPEEEIAFLTFHFGGAVLRLNSKNNIQRKVKIGVICGSGIGVSSLLKSRLKNIFKDKVEVKTFSNSKENFRELEKQDFLVATFEIEKLKVPTIKIDILFNNDQLEKISELVDYYMYSPEKEENLNDANSEKRVYRLLAETKEVQKILKNFRVYRLDENLTIYQLIKKAAEISGEDNHSKLKIEEALIKREKLYTQVLSEFKIAFLHSQIEDLSEETFYLIKPTSDNFKDESLENSETVVVMLASKENNRDETPLKKISVELFENEEFYHSILEGSEIKVKIFLEKILDNYLKEYFVKNYK